MLYVVESERMSRPRRVENTTRPLEQAAPDVLVRNPPRIDNSRKNRLTLWSFGSNLSLLALEHFSNSETY